MVRAPQLVWPWTAAVETVAEMRQLDDLSAIATEAEEQLNEFQSDEGGMESYKTDYSNTLGRKTYHRNSKNDWSVMCSG